MSRRLARAGLAGTSVGPKFWIDVYGTEDAVGLVVTVDDHNPGTAVSMSHQDARDLIKALSLAVGDKETEQ